MRFYTESLMGPGALGPVGRLFELGGESLAAQACVLAAVFLGVFVVAACRESLRSRKLAPPAR